MVETAAGAGGLSFLALVAGAAAAAAAPADESDLSLKETRRLLQDYGMCIVKGRHAAASRAILANVSNRELMNHYSALIDGNCLPRQPGMVLKVRFTGDQYRYALADALVRSEFAAGAPDISAVPPLTHRDPGSPPNQVLPNGKLMNARKFAALVANYQEGQALQFVSVFGECTVRKNPAGARALILTKPDTPAETAAFSALGEALATCLPEGRTLSFGRVALRGTLAINYYRLAKAATGATGGSVK
jgi:hypothetical protein